MNQPFLICLFFCRWCLCLCKGYFCWTVKWSQDFNSFMLFKSVCTCGYFESCSSKVLNDCRLSSCCYWIPVLYAF